MLLITILIPTPLLMKTSLKGRMGIHTLNSLPNKGGAGDKKYFLIKVGGGGVVSPQGMLPFQTEVENQHLPTLFYR